MCLHVAEVLATTGISAEVVDLRTLLPLDFEGVKHSLEKTSKLLVVHEDRRTGGIGSEVISRVIEEAWDNLDAPPRRVTAIDCHTAFALPLESAVLPNEQQILAEAQRLAAY
jgi:pyruvate/2-oxoglutarate/acetoin dehydrogenase E1 component